MDEQSHAFSLARRDLRMCYAKYGIYAGLHHFDQYWARDSFFASMGACALGDYDIVKKNFELFLRFQKPDGQLPLRIKNRFLGLRMLGLDKRPDDLTPRYTQDKGNNVGIDQNSLFIIALRHYTEKKHDTTFIKNHYEAIKKAILWNLTRDANGDALLEQGVYAGWADSVRKKGTVLYTNVLHAKALLDFSWMCVQLGKKGEHAQFLALHEKAKHALHARFWNGSYFIDWIDNGREYSYFSTDGNVLAVLFGIANETQARQIQTATTSYRINTPFPSRTNYPPYPFTQTSFLDFLVGLGNYHNYSMIWLWLGCADALAKHTLGMKDVAQKSLAAIARVITRWGAVYEVYNEKGAPVRSWFYQSEMPFAWSAGMFVWAHQTLKNYS
ncbi:hypothetical protein COY95_01510 [Candidatus Woesearchaeota archaeon CG_4_10_14_0_8_um_filter_47_5]|nr:MAG: hypothetical protein COY95_01510 [Candidatus Woesearchaeota archaeon CG_4_10_14_0_8_um_filter_47_5]